MTLRTQRSVNIVWCRNCFRLRMTSIKSPQQQQRLEFLLIQLWCHPFTCAHSSQLASCKLPTSCPWTRAAPLILTSKSCCCLTRRRSLTPKCTRKLWTLSSMSRLCSRLVSLQCTFTEKIKQRVKFGFDYPLRVCLSLMQSKCGTNHVLTGCQTAICKTLQSVLLFGFHAFWASEACRDLEKASMLH